MTENLKKLAIAWFNGPQDYNQGVELLQRVSRKGRVLNKMVRRGETRSSFEKLVYELNKVAGLKKIPVPQAKIDQKLIKVHPAEAKPGKAVKEKTEKKEEKTRYNLIGTREISSFPETIQRIVRENSKLFMLRGKSHATIKRLPEDNSKENMAKRIELMDEINKMSARLEVLFEAWKAYEDKGIEPDVKLLWPDQATQEQASEKKDPLTIEELKNLKKNIQSSITKDRNRLLYSKRAKPKDGKENPIPEGPKRTVLEKRIAKKENQISTIDKQIADLM